MKLTPRGGLLVAALAGTSAMLACSLIVPANEVQCSTDADCKARGPQFAGATCVANVCQAADAGASGGGGPWDCLDTSPERSDPKQTVDVKIVFYDELQTSAFEGNVDGGTDLQLATYSPQTGISVVACSPLDPTCASPAAGPVLSDDAGVASLALSGGFTGFYRLTGDGYVPSYFYPTARLLASQPSISFPASILGQDTYTALQAAFGTMANTNVDAGPGILAITQYDCNDRHAAGVSFTSSPAPAETIYLANSIPSPGSTQTFADGAGVLINVPSGSANITANLVAPMNRVVGTTTVVIHPGTITLVYLRPRAR